MYRYKFFTLPRASLSTSHPTAPISFICASLATLPPTHYLLAIYPLALHGSYFTRSRFIRWNSTCSHFTRLLFTRFPFISARPLYPLAPYTRSRFTCSNFTTCALYPIEHYPLVLYPLTHSRSRVTHPPFTRSPFKRLHITCSRFKLPSALYRSHFSCSNFTCSHFRRSRFPHQRFTRSCFPHSCGLPARAFYQLVL